MSKQSESPMHIVYLVANIEDISGGTRIIIEHVNRLFEHGHRVELWTVNKDVKPYFECKVPVQMADDNLLSVPDVLVMTDPGLLPKVVAHRVEGKTFLLMQHDNEWLSEVMGISTDAGLLHDYRGYFLNGTYSVMVVSTWLQKVVEAKYGIKSMLIPNVIDPNAFHPTEPLMRSDYPSVLLMYDSQIWKGFGEAIQAVLEAQKKSS